VWTPEFKDWKQLRIIPGIRNGLSEVRTCQHHRGPAGPARPRTMRHPGTMHCTVVRRRACPTGLRRSGCTRNTAATLHSPCAKPQARNP
jgi:hypothetical protein